MLNKIIVIKIGTNVITNDKCLLDELVISKLAAQVAVLKKHAYAVILVTSGAVGGGRADKTCQYLFIAFSQTRHFLRASFDLQGRFSR